MNKIFERVLKAENVLILSHVNPDGDSLGSALSFKLFLESIGKKGYIVLDDNIPHIYQFMTEGHVLKTEEFKSLDVSIDLVVAVDSSDQERFSDRQELIGDNELINIDHHITNTHYGDYNLVKEASSTGEILYNLYSNNEVKLTKAMAQALYVAISTDTGSFKYSNTSEATFYVAGKLKSYGFDFNQVTIELYQNEPLQKIKLHNRIFSTLKIYKDNIGIVYLDDDIKQAFGNRINTDGVVEYVRNINEIEVAVFIKKINTEVLKVSLRSKNDYDVSTIALAFGGGGHKNASGFSYNGTIQHCIDDILKLMK